MDTLLTALGANAPVRTLRLTDHQDSLLAGLFKTFDPPLTPPEKNREYGPAEVETWGVALSRALDEQRIYRGLRPAGNADDPSHSLVEFLGSVPGDDIDFDKDVLEQRSPVVEGGEFAEHYTWLGDLADFLLECDGLSVELVAA